MTKRPKKTSSLAIEHWPIAKVLPYARNARTHSPEQVAMLAGAIKEFGFVNPCLVDADGVLIAGHGRILAAQKLGMDTVPVIQLGYLTPEQVKALRIADNRMSELGAWDDNLLRATVAELQLGEFKLDLIGFDADAVKALLADPPGPSVSLQDRFGIVPFSVLNARDGTWQARKQAWLALGIQSEVGRGENLLKFSDSVALDGKTYQTRQATQGARKAAAANG